jgi:hypothetical protein
VLDRPHGVAGDIYPSDVKPLGRQPKKSSFATANLQQFPFPLMPEKLSQAIPVPLRV